MSVRNRTYNRCGSKSAEGAACSSNASCFSGYGIRGHCAKRATDFLDELDVLLRRRIAVLKTKH